MGESRSPVGLTTENRPVVVHKDVLFTECIRNQQFLHHHFIDTGCTGTKDKPIEISNGDFSFAFFERAYFRNVKFSNCKFIGARFSNCNFRGSTFSGCNFNYLAINGTIISVKEVLLNLPEWPNIMRDLLMAHRVNAESIGDIEAVKKFIRAELGASKEHLRRARYGREGYYSQKYSGFKNQAKVMWDSLFLWLDWNVWGHGEYPIQLVKFVAFILLAFTAVVFFSTESITPPSTINSLLASLYDSFLFTFCAFIDLPIDNPHKTNIYTLALIVISRYLTLGLFISMLFRRLSRR